MDERVKKKEYRLARNVFFILGMVFALLAGSIILKIWWLMLIYIALCVFACVYAIIRWSKNVRYYESLK